MKVLFNDLAEFLTELRADAALVEPRIVRLTTRQRYTNPQVMVSVVATFVARGMAVTLEARQGEKWPGDALDADLRRKIEDAHQRVETVAKELGLELRAGAFDE